MDIERKEGQKILSDFNNKYITYDITYKKNGQPKPIALFVHGFKGFKDWGHFPLIADFFAEKGFVFVKINLSHNGTTPEHLTEFQDLDAFGKNNFTIELSDIGKIVDLIGTDAFEVSSEEVEQEKVHLIGHSRGGTSSIIYATLDSRIKKLVTWAAVCHVFSRYTKDEHDEWEKGGVKYIYNSRTDQNMPIYYQLAEDLISNKEKYDIPVIAPQIDIPHFILHGTADLTVDVSEAGDIANMVRGAEIYLLEGADHTFGGKHPWDSSELPQDSLILCKKTVDFLLK